VIVRSPVAGLYVVPLAAVNCEYPPVPVITSIALSLALSK